MSIKEHREKLKKVVEFAKEAVVTYVVDGIVQRSPIHTGDYIISHIAEPGPMVYPREDIPTPGPYPPRRSDAVELAAAVRKRLLKQTKTIMDKNNKVSINNMSGHAHYVEYIGWVPSGGGTPPWFVFAGAVEGLKLHRKSMMNYVKTLAFTLNTKSYVPRDEYMAWHLENPEVGLQLAEDLEEQNKEDTKRKK